MNNVLAAYAKSGFLNKELGVEFNARNPLHHAYATGQELANKNFSLARIHWKTAKFLTKKEGRNEI